MAGALQFRDTSCTFSRADSDPDGDGISSEARIPLQLMKYCLVDKVRAS